jgi:hypothetical protein
MKRIANFFAVVGVIMVILFLVSDSVHTPHLSYLVYGVLLIGASLTIGLFGPRSSAPPSEPKYFRILKGRRKEEKIDRQRERKE